MHCALCIIYSPTEYFELMADARVVEAGTSADALVKGDIAEKAHPDARWRGIADTHLADAEYFATFGNTIIHQRSTYFDSLVKLFLRHRWLIEEIARTSRYLAMNDTRNGRKIVIHTHIDDAQLETVLATEHIHTATATGDLTATLVREDHKETEVFSLIGPKKFDIPWRILEAQGWIATADCNEIRIPMEPELKMKYALAPVRDKITLASTNPEKTDIVERLLKYFSKPDDRVLIIGQYIDQLEALSEDLQIPLITGKTPNKDREKLYAAFRSGSQKNLMVSKVGNFAIDLPDANVLIQISGTFGSRQEEAQRLGRVLRPKSDGGAAHFYSIVTQDSKEQEFAMNRQLFLTEQGYAYKIMKRGDWDILCRTPEELAARG